jgi:3-hydroxyisobutyrate dehydrogenase
MAERVGYVGLGIMGRGMAHNLLKAGFSLTVWNRTASRIEPLVEAGAKAGKSPADVAAQSDIVVICVSDTPDVEAVILGPDGILQGAKEGSLVIDCSTISPAATVTLAKKLAEKGVAMLDAPVSGGSVGAWKG